MERKYQLDYLLIGFIVASYAALELTPYAKFILWAAVVLGSFPTLSGSISGLLEKRINIDSFNIFAIAASFAYGDVRSSAFIVLMLSFARLLDSYTESRTRRTLEELLRLKPDKALLESQGGNKEVQADSVDLGQIVIVSEGARVPVDGQIIFGRALMNQSSVTGESLPVEKGIGEEVLQSTLNVSGLIKVKAIRVGKDSTIERMAALIKESAKNKSRPEKLADRFAAIYLPVVLLIGILTYVFTANLQMTAALFLVACADDMAVAIPLAVTAAIGRSARRGVVIKGGEWMESLSKIDTLVVDKTGTLTYGEFAINKVEIEPGVDEGEFWQNLAVVEKLSDHPIGRLMGREAAVRVGVQPDPEEFTVIKGAGAKVIYLGQPIFAGNDKLLEDESVKLTTEDRKRISSALQGAAGTCIAVFSATKLYGFITIGDRPKANARNAVSKLKKLGVSNITIFTGDNQQAAEAIGRELGIEDVRFAMSPQDKVRGLEDILTASRTLAMVGDGVNDAAALARADLGIAMGRNGAAVSVEAADVVIMNDDLATLPDMIAYSRRVMSVIRLDMILWVVTNIIGFGLVFTGVLGPALAAFYNFASDFVPLINSARLFRKEMPSN